MYFAQRLLVLVVFACACTHLAHAVYTRKTQPVCDNGIFQGGICQLCMQNCTTCDQPGGCDSCDGVKFQYSNGKCVPKKSYADYLEFQKYKKDRLSTEAESCLEGCVGNGTYVCTSCDKGYKLLNGFCQACETAHCQQCAQDQATCQLCLPGYSLQSNQCLPCSDSHCLTCSPAVGNCQTCQEGYFVSSGACVSCGVTGCAQCSSAGTCSTCQNGYYASGGSCTVCPTNAIYCGSGGTPIQCDDKYALIDGQCVAVNFLYYAFSSRTCMTFMNSYQCASCWPGYVLVNYQCVRTTCAANEYADVDTMVCTSCGDGVVLCAQTNAGTITISKCKTGWYLDSNACVQCADNPNFGSGKVNALTCTSTQITSCAPGFSQNPSQNDCTACSNNCQECEFDSVTGVMSLCNKCLPGYVLSSSDPLLCTPCVEWNNCYTCIESDLMVCETCAKNYFLNPFKQCANSIPNCYQIDMWGCRRCKLGYYRAEDRLSCLQCTSTTQECANLECIASQLVDVPPQTSAISATVDSGVPVLRAGVALALTLVVCLLL